MYEELVKRLRQCEQFQCRECEYEQVMGCRAKLNEETANAIEELSRDLDSMNDANIALYGALPKWIPVTERLPNEMECVLCETDAHEMFIASCYISNDGNDFDFDDDNGMMWDGRVTHWMPLPEPPKEGE